MTLLTHVTHKVFPRLLCKTHYRTIETLISILFSKMRNYIRFQHLLLYFRCNGNHTIIETIETTPKKSMRKVPTLHTTCAK